MCANEITGMSILMNAPLDTALNNVKIKAEKYTSHDKFSMFKQNTWEPKWILKSIQFVKTLKNSNSAFPGM